MKGLDLNLARQPFVNARPIGRLTALLWALGVGLLAVNAFLYWDYFTSSEDRKQQLSETGGQVADHRQEIARLKARLGNLNLADQNAQIEFLNHKIAERTFAWSLLFDRLAEIQPNNVRLVSLTPDTSASESRGRRRGGQPPGERVLLSIASVARDGDSQLEFVDRLFSHPAFENPSLSQDTRLEDGQFSFNLTVTYLPNAVSPGEGVGENAETAPRRQTETATAAPGPRNTSTEATLAEIANTPGASGDSTRPTPGSAPPPGFGADGRPSNHAAAPPSGRSTRPGGSVPPSAAPPSSAADSRAADSGTDARRPSRRPTRPSRSDPSRNDPARPGPSGSDRPAGSGAAPIGGTLVGFPAGASDSGGGGSGGGTPAAGAPGGRPTTGFGQRNSLGNAGAPAPRQLNASGTLEPE